MSKKLHNPKNLILRHFLADYRREIYGRELEGKVPMSQKGIALTLNGLERDGILKSRKSGNMKYFRLNDANSEIRDIITAAEIERKVSFLGKKRKLAEIFRNDERIVGIFGSYAKGTENADSDLDIFVIGRKDGNDYEKSGDSMDIPASVKHFSEAEFDKLLKEKNSLCSEIAGNHIMIFGTERFVNMLWRDYYGFS